MERFDPAVVSRRVREEREKSGMSLSQLAAAAGLTKAYLVRLENQGGNPTIDALMGIADALDLTIADLVGTPKLVFDFDEQPVSPSLLAYADAAKLTSAEVRTLASIQFRKQERPRSVERWRFIHDSLRASRQLDPRDGEDSD